MDVSIIIVNYNTKDLLKNCLGSIYKQTKDITFEIIVSDNGSTDGSIEMIKKMFPNILLIENNTNLGFGTANNKGLTLAKGKYIFYLNSDTILLNNAVKILHDYWEASEDKEKIGALGTALLGGDMKYIHSYGTFKTYKQYCKINLSIFLKHIKRTLQKIISYRNEKIFDSENYQEPFYGEINGYITGADLFVLNDSNARFDENFFLYCEEVDLELQMKEKGLKRIIIEGPQIQHLTVSAPKDFYIARFADVCIQDSCIYYSKKNFKKNPVLLKVIIFLDRLNPVVRKLSKKIPCGNKTK